jgi:hypothetical protein
LRPKRFDEEPMPEGGSNHAFGSMRGGKGAGSQSTYDGDFERLVVVGDIELQDVICLPHHGESIHHVEILGRAVRWGGWDCAQQVDFAIALHAIGGGWQSEGVHRGLGVEYGWGVAGAGWGESSRQQQEQEGGEAVTVTQELQSGWGEPWGGSLQERGGGEGRRCHGESPEGAKALQYW